jgi:glycosyltransferase involved in cell wall biosynthesis
MSLKPSILQVFNQYLEPGGEEEWVNQLMRLGKDHFTMDEVRFHSGAWVGKGAPNRWNQASMLWNNPASRAMLRKRVKEFPPEVLLFHNLVPVASLAMYEEAADLGLPVVQYIHNFRPFSPSGTLWLNGRINAKALSGNPWPEVFGKAWESSFFKTLLIAIQHKRLLASGRLDVVMRWIAVSDFMRDHFIQAGFPAERVVTLRHCWETRPEAGTVHERNHYLFLGRMVAEKGLHTLFDAWRILEGRLGAACPRLIVAGVGPLEALAHAWASRMNRVSCVGFVSGQVKQDLLRSCRGLIAPSVWWEPLGLIVHEAYDAVRPVLAARSGGLTETVFQGQTGYLHEPGAAECLANDVERMEAIGRDGRAAMGQAGREWLLKNASPVEWRERFVEIVREAVQG